ncbi:MAG: hypothetical protein AAFU80_11705 [Pseudomonadota bacterium]
MGMSGLELGAGMGFGHDVWPRPPIMAAVSGGSLARIVATSPPTPTPEGVKCPSVGSDRQGQFNDVPDGEGPG